MSKEKKLLPKTRKSRGMAKVCGVRRVDGKHFIIRTGGARYEY